MDKGENKNIYNVSTDESYTVIEVTKMICEGMGKNFDDCVEYVEECVGAFLIFWLFRTHYVHTVRRLFGYAPI